MTAYARPAALAIALALAPAGFSHAAVASGLQPHRASYALSLDPSKPSQKLDGADGRIDYEIKGNACEGYSVKLRQANTLDTGEGPTTRSDMLSTSWEDGTGNSYRFKTVNRTNGEVRSDVDAVATRTDQGIKVEVAKPRQESVQLKGKILMPTQHVVKVLEAAAAGESVFEAKVFDGSDDGDKVYDTLAIIGRPKTDESGLPDAAKSALAGRTYYPVTVSYYGVGETGQTPAYAMSFTLYDNGVIGSLKIDYNDFVLRGSLDNFEVLKAADAPCGK